MAPRWKGRLVYDRPDASPSTEGVAVPEKSPQKPAGKKAGKSLKEKREVKKAKKGSKTGF